MNALAATEYYTNHQLVRYDPQAAQQARDTSAQQRQLRAVTPDSAKTPSEQTLEGELLNKQERQQQAKPEFDQDEYLARHQDEYARAARGHLSQSQRAIDAYQSTAQVTHPADVDRVGLLDIYV